MFRILTGLVALGLCAACVSEAAAGPNRQPLSRRDPRRRLPPEFVRRADGTLYERSGQGQHPALLGKRRGQGLTASGQGGMVINAPGYNAHHRDQREQGLRHDGGFDLGWIAGEDTRVVNPFGAPAMLSGSADGRWVLTGPRGQRLELAHIIPTAEVLARGAHPLFFAAHTARAQRQKAPFAGGGWLPVRVAQGEVFARVQPVQYFEHPHLHLGAGAELLGLPRFTPRADAWEAKLIKPASARAKIRRWLGQQGLAHHGQRWQIVVEGQAFWAAPARATGPEVTGHVRRWRTPDRTAPGVIVFSKTLDRGAVDGLLAELRSGLRGTVLDRVAPATIESAIDFVRPLDGARVTRLLLAPSAREPGSPLGYQLKHHRDGRREVIPLPGDPSRTR